MAVNRLVYAFTNLQPCTTFGLLNSKQQFMDICDSLNEVLYMAQKRTIECLKSNFQLLPIAELQAASSKRKQGVFFVIFCEKCLITRGSFNSVNARYCFYFSHNTSNGVLSHRHFVKPNVSFRFVFWREVEGRDARRSVL